MNEAGRTSSGQGPRVPVIVLLLLIVFYGLKFVFPATNQFPMDTHYSAEAESVSAIRGPALSCIV
jgi:hypothetical protein